MKVNELLFQASEEVAARVTVACPRFYKKACFLVNRQILCPNICNGVPTKNKETVKAWCFFQVAGLFLTASEKIPTSSFRLDPESRTV
jgi:hypothetical protein